MISVNPRFLLSRFKKPHLKRVSGGLFVIFTGFSPSEQTIRHNRNIAPTRAIFRVVFSQVLAITISDRRPIKTLGRVAVGDWDDHYLTYLF